MSKLYTGIVIGMLCAYLIAMLLVFSVKAISGGYIQDIQKYNTLFIEHQKFYCIPAKESESAGGK